MEKTLRVGDVVGLSAYLTESEDIFDGMKLNAKSLYSVLKLKKAIIERAATAQETIMALAKTYDAIPMEPTPDGRQAIKVPPEKLEDFNKDYNELMKEEVEVPYDNIEISANAEISPKFMEAFFDFIIITD